jgi:type IV pilus assembly protein PilY1
MQKIKTSLFIVPFLFLSLAVTGFAMDTDLYVLSGVDIPPNVLILLDSSASMSEVSTGQIYDQSIDYSSYAPATLYPRYSVYYRATGSKWTIWQDDYRTILCTDLKNQLNDYGQAINYGVNMGSTDCGNAKRDFQTGNYMNFLQLTGGPGGNLPRFGLATGIIHSYINTTSGVRFAVMTYNKDRYGKTVLNNAGAEYVNSNPGDADGANLLGFVDENKAGKATMFSALSGLKNDTWSPMAESLYEAGAYFKGQTSAITGTSYSGKSPVQYYCQKNYVLIISDGDPTKDSDSRLAIADSDGDGSKLDDVAKDLYNIDMSNGQSLKKQNITTYTIGFSLTHPLLEETAKNGGGKYYYVWSSQSFSVAFQKFIIEVLDKSVSYVAPVVPISQMEKTTAGERMYLAMFKPELKSFWGGNVKKYGIATQKSESVNLGDVLDANDSPVMDSDNQIKDTAKSYWSTAADGGDVEKGGVGQLLLERTSERNIYTYLGTNADLKDSSNLFSVSNSAITPPKLGLIGSDTTGRNKVINFIHGFDAYDENGNRIVTEKRDWILGSFIHSRPLVIHYGTTRSVVFAGANDGMLHAFDDATGQELWAFIPPTLLPYLKDLSGEVLEFFVDGSPKAYFGTDKTVLMFGLRRGGDRYIALDISSPESPKFLWEIGPSTAGYQELGQTWSTPQLGKIADGSSGRWVAFIGGGYDTNQDSSPAPVSDTKGRAIYVVDIQTGGMIWSYSNANNPEMKYSIPSDITRLDIDGDGKIDRLYVGDTGGRIWRFDIGDAAPGNWSGKLVFNSNPGTSDHRKIFYPVDVTLESDKSKANYEMLLFGTGDREHPKNSTNVNRLYAVKDRGLSSALTESNLVDVTTDILQNTTATADEKSAILNALETQSGWFIKLDQNAGEKCLSMPVVFAGVVYYTTFTPSVGSETDVCFLGEGTGRIYALKYKTGNAAFNLDSENDFSYSSPVVERSDRSKIVGAAIPSGIIVTFVKGTAVGYVGTGGGVYIPKLLSTKSLIPVSWRIVF